MISTFEKFLALHQQDEPLLIANVWDAQSAKLFEKLQFKALATSSSAVAATLGYPDGEQMSFEEYFFVIKRIKASTNLPFSVDLEGGYGKTSAEIIANLKKLHEVGVVGINIEDSSVANGSRKIDDAGTFAEKLGQITKGMTAAGLRIFINVRCDAFLLGLPDARYEAIRRMKLYEGQGIHGLFLPCITDINDIKAASQSTRLPLNVMCMATLPDFKALEGAGVKRISMGNFVNVYGYGEIERVVKSVQEEKKFSFLFPA